MSYLLSCILEDREDIILLGVILGFEEFLFIWKFGQDSFILCTFFYFVDIIGYYVLVDVVWEFVQLEVLVLVESQFLFGFFFV